MSQPKKNYLITGGAGFIGSHLVEKVFNSLHTPIIIDDLTSGYLNNIKDLNNFLILEKSVQDLDKKELPKIDGIFHLAAQASVPLSINDFYNSCKNNLLSSIKILDWAREFNVPIVYASSSAIYGNLPLGSDESSKINILSPYAQDKLALESYAKLAWNLYSVPSIGLRFFNVYGPRQDPKNPYSGVISIFIENILKNREVIVYGGHQTRDFIYVQDVVDVLYRSMQHLENSPTCNILNVGTGISTTINNLLKVISSKLNIKPKVKIEELLEGDPELSMGSYDKFSSILNINIDSFIKLESGIENTINEIREKAIQ